MQSHSNRSAYFVLNEGIVPDLPTQLGSSGCPFGAAGAAAAALKSPAVPSFKFGRMFDKSPINDPNTQEFKDLLKSLIALGECMNDPQTYGHKPLPPAPALSGVPAGYTYLGQFIAHEITFDNLQELPETEPDPNEVRSPCIDLDSLYGAGPDDNSSKQYYFESDPALLKIGSTQSFNGIVRPNDLPRIEKGTDKGKANIADPRNDDNLAVAQTQVAFIRFHNEVVSRLRLEGHNTSDLFDCARMQVVRHFQWIILHDFLPKFVDNNVLDSVMTNGRVLFKADANNLYMPLEFSAAAFRLGHSMVRSEYQWNKYHASKEQGSVSPATLDQLFAQTAASGGIGKTSASQGLTSDWMIDWTRFFKFKASPAEPQFNMAGKIDTNFDLHLPQSFPAPGIPDNKKLLTVRNLLRGLALSLPTGQKVAEKMLEKNVLTQQDILTEAEILAGPEQDILNSPVFINKTPLWFYILKEAEVRGAGKLGPLGSRIVAETLFGLIECSPNSILKAPNWRPRFWVDTPQDSEKIYEMADLLEFAKVVNPFA